MNEITKLKTRVTKLGKLQTVAAELMAISQIHGTLHHRRYMKMMIRAMLRAVTQDKLHTERKIAELTKLAQQK
jgi:hypothetical protein